MSNKKYLSRLCFSLALSGSLIFLPGLTKAEDQELYKQAEQALEDSSNLNEKLGDFSKALDQAKREEEERKEAERKRQEEEKRLAEIRAQEERSAEEAQAGTGSGRTENTSTYEITDEERAAYGENTANGAAYYRQTDPKYGSYPVGSSNVYNAGCGPFSMAIATATVKKADLNPIEFVNYANRNGFIIDGVGTSWGYFSSMGNKYGISVRPISDPAEAIEAVNNGNPVILSQNSSLGGYWTYGGHFVVLVGQNSDGTFKVNDPASLRRTSISHTYDQVFIPNKSMWIVSQD